MNRSVRTWMLGMTAILALSGTGWGQLEIEVPFNKKAEMVFDFESDAWKGAGVISGLHKMGSGLAVMGMNMNEEAKTQTTIYVVRNEEAIFFGFEFLDEEIEKIRGLGEINEDAWPVGENAEIYLDGDRAEAKDYYHFVWNVSGSRAESEKQKVVKADGWEVITTVEEDRWKAVVKIPYKKLGISPDADGLRGLFYRDYHSHRKSEEANERSTWGGGALHDPGAFGDLIFKEKPAS